MVFQSVGTGMVTALLLCSCDVRHSHANAPSPISGTAGNLIDFSSVRFSRDEGGTSGTLSFAARKKLACEFLYWSGKTVTSPVRMSCDDGQVFQIKVAPLDAEETYAFKIFVWDEGRDGAKYFSFQESAQPGASLKTLTIVRISVPEMATEISEQNLDSPLTSAQIKSQLTPPLGCREGDLERVLLASEPTPLEITAISSDGFGASLKPSLTAKRWRADQDYFELGRNWQWSFQRQDASYQFISLPPAQIQSLSLTSGAQSTEVDQTKAATWLELAKVPLAESDIHLSWQTLYSSSSFLAIEIKNAANTNAIHCVFKNDDGHGTIPKAQIASLPRGSLLLTAILESSEIYVKAQRNFPPWLIRSQDWRFAHLTKM